MKSNGNWTLKLRTLSLVWRLHQLSWRSSHGSTSDGSCKHVWGILSYVIVFLWWTYLTNGDTPKSLRVQVSSAAERSIGAQRNSHIPANFGLLPGIIQLSQIIASSIAYDKLTRLLTVCRDISLGKLCILNPSSRNVQGASLQSQEWSHPQSCNEESCRK